jgi:hypothetical protein
MTKRRTTDTDRANISTLYGAYQHHRRKVASGKGHTSVPTGSGSVSLPDVTDASTGNRIGGNDLTTSGPSVKNDMIEREQRQLTGIHKGMLIDERFPKYLYICYPASKGHVMELLKISHETKISTDRILVRRIKKKYLELRPLIMRLRDLSGFSAIELVRVFMSTNLDRHYIPDSWQFELYHHAIAVPAIIKWEWPTETNKEWESAIHQSDPVSHEGISLFMRHLWLADCNLKPSVTETPKRRKGWIPRVRFHFQDEVVTLPTEEIPTATFAWLSWVPCVESITVYIPDRKVPTPGGSFPTDLHACRLQADLI